MTIPFDTKIELKNILIAHDVEKMRDFILSNGMDVGGVELSDSNLDTLMHVYKSQMVFLGDSFKNSRNFLRTKELGEENIKRLANLYGSLPNCYTCKNFRTAPVEGEQPCMLLGAIPEDIPCAEYTQDST